MSIKPCLGKGKESNEGIVEPIFFKHGASFLVDLYFWVDQTKKGVMNLQTNVKPLPSDENPIIINIFSVLNCHNVALLNVNL